MSRMDISPLIREKAPLILAEIKKAKSILLHCHPSPDPDSVGSALAMKFALAQLGKKATVIQGDSEIPQAFMHFPGAEEIVRKSFGDLDLKQFDLFISLDTASVDRVTANHEKILQVPVVVNIDHHRTNTNFGLINLVEATYPSTTQILFDLLEEWGMEITEEIASDLFIGIYTDTGGFKFDGTTKRTFEIASKLVPMIPNFAKLISDMENTNTPADLCYQALSLNSIESFLGGKVALSAISHDEIVKCGLPPDQASARSISSIMRTVTAWKVVGSMAEIKPKTIKISFRSKDSDRFDVSRLTVALGGGGHKAAAGVTLQNMTMAEAKKLVVAKAKELYNF